jgi:hypothetical protein
LPAICQNQKPRQLLLAAESLKPIFASTVKARLPRINAPMRHPLMRAPFSAVQVYSIVRHALPQPIYRRASEEHHLPAAPVVVGISVSGIIELPLIQSARHGAKKETT